MIFSGGGGGFAGGGPVEIAAGLLILGLVGFAIWRFLD
jgi:hypothetical protein